MSEVVQIAVSVVIAILGSSGMWAFLDHKRERREETRRQETAEERAERTAVKALIRVELVRESLRFIELGSITVEEADALTELYEPYEVLGGNGNGKRLYEQALSLPRRTGRTVDRT